MHTLSKSLVPTAPPDNVQALVSSSTAILVIWDPVPEIDRNGIVTQYEVEFNQSTFNEISTSNLTATNGSKLMMELEGLEEYAEYTIRVRAYTIVGPGSFSIAVVNRTLENGEFGMEHLLYDKLILLVHPRKSWLTIAELLQLWVVILFSQQASTTISEADSLLFVGVS